jgi:hypothetical protein
MFSTAPARLDLSVNDTQIITVAAAGAWLGWPGHQILAGLQIDLRDVWLHDLLCQYTFQLVTRDSIAVLCEK